MDTGQIALDDLARKLAGRPVYFRIALARDAEGWTFRTCEATVGAEPPGWVVSSWVYRAHAFVAVLGTAQDLFNAMSGPSPEPFALGPVPARVPPVFQTANWRHLPSRAPYDARPLPWPTVDYEISGPNPLTGDSTGFLVAEGAPSFPDVSTAQRAFFYGDYSTVGAGPTTSRTALVRDVRQEAWIERVTVRATHVDVQLRGQEVAGVGIELSSGSRRERRTSGPRGRVRLQLPQGLPNDAWLYVTRGDRWLDYRPLGERLPGSSAMADRGIELVLPDDIDSRVQALVAQGEGPRVEFKSRLPLGSQELRRGVFKTVAAFANADGGSMVFGIDPDEVTVTGVDAPDPQGTRDRLADLLNRVLQPVPMYEIRWTTTSDRVLFLLEVRAGTTRPYGVRLQSDGNIEYYIRRGASTFPAPQQEVRDLVLGSAPEPQGPRRLP